MSQGNHVSLAFAPKDSWKQLSFGYLFFEVTLATKVAEGRRISVETKCSHLKHDLIR